MRDSQHFKTGDIVFIRFRLFSDTSLYGWGWAIDNLKIQDSSVAVEDFIIKPNFHLFPNPADNDFITIDVTFEQAVQDLQFILYDSFGRRVEQHSLSPTNARLQYVIKIDHYAKGLYWATLQINGQEQIGKALLLK